MSIHAMNVVWQSFPRGGSEKLALLALADWCDDDGLSLHPSIATLAKKISTSPSQARRIVHGFIAEGILEVVGNHNGGAKGDSRHYRLHFNKISTASTNATPSTRATPSTDARDGLHPCALPLAPMLAKPPLTIKEPPCPENPDAESILQYLNDRAKRSYRPVRANLTLIAARLKEGATADECRAVIDAKVAQWDGDSKMQRYLRPETLFNATKFAQYVGELDSQSATGGEKWE
jgi:uncharacterized phage protein (TIGR02220 family)